MKRQIRQGVFETNSSSEHSIAIVSKNDFERWKKGELAAKCIGGPKEAFEESGNIWSNMYAIQFCPIEEKEERNLEIINTRYFEFLNAKDSFHPFYDPNELLEAYNNGEVAIDLSTFFCSYQDYIVHGFVCDVEYPYEFAHNLQDNKVLSGAHYHT